MDTPLVILLVGLFVSSYAGNPKLLTKMNRLCGPEPVDYKFVQEDEDVLKACLEARAEYEAKNGKQLKWDANTYIMSGPNYAMKIRVKPMTSGKEAFIHIMVSPTGKYLREQEGFFKRKDCISIPPEDPAGPKLLAWLDNNCSSLLPPKTYEFVRNNSRVLTLAKSARAAYEASGYGETLKWDSNTFVAYGSDYYGVKIRVKRMNDSKIAFVHVLVNASGLVDLQEGEFTKRDCIDIPAPLFDEEQLITETTLPNATVPATTPTSSTTVTTTTQVTTVTTAPEGTTENVPTNEFSRQMDERCDQTYYKVADDLWDIVKGLKAEITEALGTEVTLFQPRVYIRKGDDKYVKVRILGFNGNAGLRYIHVHIDGDGKFVGLVDDKNRKSCIEIF